MATLDELKLKRKVIKSALTRQETFVNEFSDDDDILLLDQRVAGVNELFKQYNIIQSEIEILQLSNVTEGRDSDLLEIETNKERNKVECQYYNILAKIKSFLIKNDNASNANNPGTSQNSQGTIINIQKSSDYSENTNFLKPLPLPKFSGKHSNWFTFFESFEALAHNDSTLSNIKKFHYLRGCLEGDALRAIESLSVSNDNYVSAIDLLKKRFENKRLIVYEHINNILNISALAKSSHVELRELLDTVNNNTAALKTLGLPVDNWDSLLIAIISEKLDFYSKKEWQASLEKTLPTYQKFHEFLEKRYQILESLTTVKNPNHSKYTKPSLSKKSEKPYSTMMVAKIVCCLCKNSHNLFQCNEFLSLTVKNRMKQVETLKLCQNCLRKNHTTEQCKTRYSCKECKQRHHTLLHINEFVPSPNSLHVAAQDQVLLSTATIYITDKVGNFHNCRVLLDQGSEVNIITNKLKDKLNLPARKIETCISGVNMLNNTVSEGVNVTIKSQVSEFATNFDCLVVNKISRPIPSVTFDKKLIEIPPNITLADPNFNISRDVDMLIGAQLFWRLIIGGPVQLKQNQPYYQQTRFGWLVGGNINTQVDNSNLACNLVSSLSDSELNNQVSLLWDQDEVENQIRYSKEQLDCENHFVENTIRAPNGQFIVKLPFKQEPLLGDSRLQAQAQLINLEKRLENNKSLKLSYTNFMREYLNLNHMELVPKTELETPNCYYLPHHAVFKQTVSGPKIRVVFNASAKTTNSLSLNDNLLTGPTIQQDLFSILCRFRIPQFALSADITQMYRMILVNSKDTEFQRILWRDDPHKPIQTFRLKTVTYGTTCAPFLATRALKEVALDIQYSDPLISTIISRDFYMDDLLTGSNTVQETITIRNKISDALSSGGFNLCKWASNCSELLSINKKEPSPISLDKTNGEVKVLGFYWNCSTDELVYKVDVPKSSEKVVTKRNILATTAKIFDPLGLINPIIVLAKILLQKIWMLGLDWDQPVPTEIEIYWTNFVNELQVLNQFKIPRKLVNSISSHSAELHGFADASSKAYGAAIYLRIADLSGNATINLISSKSRVAPIKHITLPRLELNAAVLLTKLMTKIIEALNIQIHKLYYWSDSTIVLSWLAEEPCRWKQYVANRVAQIQSTSSYENWRHVRSADNPADIVSRGMSPQQLHQSTLWWHGPEWLKNNQGEWPTLSGTNMPSKSENDTNLERKVTVLVNTSTTNTELPVISKYSSFFKLQRIIAYVLRFINNCKGISRETKSLTITELEQAKTVIFRHIQNIAFPYELDKKSPSIKSSRLAKLDPFLDDKGVIRVGGRLKHSLISYDKKYLIILPQNHHITKLIIRETHERDLHAGNEATLAAVRQQFWPLSARNTVRKLIHNCVKCTRANPHYLTTKMGNLPKERLQPVRPFYKSGVDYAGPYLIKNGKGRSTCKVKAYVALFICFVTKAIHLELVTDLTTESFLAALKRFISRRGNVAELYSDNGTNFVGAERELLRSKTFQENISRNLEVKNINFHFIPPKSPHFGGLWERAVRSVKHHLRRVLGDTSLTFEEFYTLLTCIEACLNSRPLTPLSSDPNDLQPLTPGHFLIGEPLTAPIETDLRPLPQNRLSRWQRIQQLQQNFWERWYKEYLHQLQVRPQGQRKQQPNILIGTMVALVEDNIPPLRWILGRVTDVHPGSDGVVRVVTVKTNSGLFKRAVKKVSVIPTED